MRWPNTWPFGLCLGACISYADVACAQPNAPAIYAQLQTSEPETVADSRVSEPAGYRTDDYRSPTPPGLTGAITIDTAAAKLLFDAGTALFVDVLPRAPKPKGLPPATIWRPKARDDIPGSIWLVDAGYGELAPVMEQYFLDGLARATGGDKSKPLVFYCLRDCWMSWNAAKRAIAAGYEAVHWYPEGTDGWSAAGFPVERREPVPRPDE